MTRSASLDYRVLQRRFDGVYIANNGYDKNRATTAIRNGNSDMVAFGAVFLANPDLVERLSYDWPMTLPDPETFYVDGKRGYTDYPAFTPADNLQS